MSEEPSIDPGPRRSSLAAWMLWPLLAGGLSLYAFQAVGRAHLDDFLIDLGSLQLPTPAHTSFLALWTTVGAVACGLFGLGLARVFSIEGERWLARWKAGPDWVWIAVGSLAALGVAVAIRSAVLQGAPLTDDESAYRFMAETLLSGQVAAPSPPSKLFFDRGMMINDGHLYAAYTLGWPALLAAGTSIGVGDIVNALCFGLTVPPVFLVLRRLAGRSWARLGIILVVTSPMMAIAAATEMSHTSCTMALAWTFWFAFRARDEDAPWWSHFGLGLFFSAAFFIRPQSTIGPGLVLLVWWALGLRRWPWRRRLHALAAFAVPAVILGGLFLAINALQNGSMWKLSYQRILEYTVENEFRFTTIRPDEIGAVANFDFGSLDRAIGTTAGGLYRLGVSLLGWPLALLPIFFAGRRRGAGLFWLCGAGSLLTLLFVMEPGVDSFGPVHFFELGLIALLLVVIGLSTATDWLAKIDRAGLGLRIRLSLLPGAVAATAVAFSFIAYTPVRLGAVSRIADDVNTPKQALESQGIDRAVVFTVFPYIRPCTIARSWVFWRPNNDPALENDVLWANHISLDADRELVEQIGNGRRGYLMSWNTRKCSVTFVPLEEVQRRADEEREGTGPARP